MKVLHLIDSLERGGQEMFLVALATEQVARGHEVSIACLEAGGILKSEIESRGIEVIVRPPELSSKVQQLVWLRGRLRLNKPDVIHAHNRRPLIFGALAALLVRSPVITTRHGDNVRGIFWNLAAARAAMIVNVTSALYESSSWINRHLYAKKNINIPNGIPVSLTDSSIPQPGRVLMVGRLNKVKNHMLALEAMARVKKMLPDIALHIVGDGPERERIRSKVAELQLASNVTLWGDRSDVANHLWQADIFLMTSDSEGHSIALLEAAAAGVPAVVTDVGGNADIIENGERGLVCPAGDSEALAMSLHRLISERDLRQKMATNTRQWSLEVSSIQRCADQYDKIYQQAAR